MKSLTMLRFIEIITAVIVAVAAGCNETATNGNRVGQAPVNKILDRRVSVTCTDEPITDVIDQLRKQCGANIEVERDVLPESYHQMPLVTCSLENVPLGSALVAILSPHGLTYSFADNVIIIIRDKKKDGEERGVRAVRS
jgi:hypothetical protein